MRRSLQEAWSELTPHLDEALELEGEARERWLDDLHSRAPDIAERIRACLRELTRLEAQSFLSVTPVSMLMAPDLKGQRFGAYTLDEVIGQGGMGTVWLAHRSDGQFEGRAAVKLLHTAATRYPAGARFTREASVLAKLQHPNIAHMLDTGITEAGQPYLVLEYIRGDRIDDYCERHGLGIEQRIRLFLDVLRAVAHAHSNLIVHRDLKPSNILVTDDGVVKLLDFGVASLLSDASEVSPHAAGVAAPGLTPGYAAPEQLLGRQVTTATDVYALGMVLFVLLAGKHPVASEEVKSTAELVRLTLDVPMPRLSTVAASEDQAKGLRGDLEAIVAKALDRDPLVRYSTADLLAQDLRCYLAVEPISARPHSFGYRLGRFVRRNSAAVTGVSLAALAILATSGLAVWQMLEANRQRNVAQEQAVRAESTRDFLNYVLTDAGATGKPFTTSELLLRAERSVQAQYGAGGNPAALEQLINLAVLNSGMGQDKKAQELLERVHRGASAANYTNLRWRSACALANVYQSTGKLREADALFEQTVEEVRRRAPTSAVLVSCLQQQSDLRLTEEDIPGGVALARDAVRLADIIFAGSPLSQIAPRVQLATAYRLAGELQPADTLYRQILERMRELGRERTADAVALYSSWGAVKSDAGDILGAVQLIESALTVGRALRPDESPDQTVGVNYAKRLIVLNRFEEAERYLARARQVASREGDIDLEVISLLATVAARRESGDAAAAVEALNSAESFVQSHFPEDHPARRLLLLETGLTRLAAGSLLEAKAALTQASTDYSRAKARITNEVQAFAGLARTELALGDLAAAEVHSVRAAALASRFAIPGAPSYWVGFCQLVQAEVDKARHQAASARELALRATAELVPTVGKDHPLVLEAANLTAAP